MSDTETDLPRLLLLGSGDRRYREYMLAAISTHCRLWMLDAHEATWQSPYLEGSDVLDVRDSQALLQAATRVAEARTVNGVFTYDETLVHAAAVLAGAMGLPGSPPEAILACRDKALTRSILTAAGIPQPASKTVATAEQALFAAEAIGYPVVVKARGLAGSIGVARADTSADIAAAFAAADSGSYPGTPRYQAGVLVEQYLAGPEISVDSVIVDGQCVPMVVARKHSGMEPFFEETGHDVRGADPLLTDERLHDQLHRIHKALGITHGATHTEFKLTPDGLRLVEINARLGGDFIPYLGYLATGTHPAVAAALVAAGRTPDTSPRHHKTAAIRFLYPPHDCEAIDTVVHNNRLGSSVHRAVATAGPGMRLALPPRGYMSRYGYVIAVDEDPAQVERDLATPEQLVELRSRPLDG